MTSVTTTASPRPLPPTSPCATPITPPPESPPTSSPPVSLLDFATVFDDEYDDALPVDLGLLRLVGEACPPPPKRAHTIVAPTPVVAGDGSDEVANVVRAWLATYYPDEVKWVPGSSPDATVGFRSTDDGHRATLVCAYWVRAHVAADAQFDTVVMARDPVALHATLDADLPGLAALYGPGGVASTAKAPDDEANEATVPSYTVTTLDARGLCRWIRGSVGRASVPVGRVWKRLRGEA